MSHISSLGAALFTDLAVSIGTVNASGVASATAVASPYAEATWKAAFATEYASGAGAAGTFIRIANVREFPSIGTPPNIVNVPSYQQKQTATIQGQADAPSLEVTINFQPSLWAKAAAQTPAAVLGNMIGDGITRAWRFSLLQSLPTNYLSTDTTGMGQNSVGNSQYFWNGKLEAMLVKPDLKDALTATLTLSIQSDFYGAFTNT